jgi:hypothetical protein
MVNNKKLPGNLALKTLLKNEGRSAIGQTSSEVKMQRDKQQRAGQGSGGQAARFWHWLCSVYARLLKTMARLRLNLERFSI